MHDIIFDFNHLLKNKSLADLSKHIYLYKKGEYVWQILLKNNDKEITHLILENQLSELFSLLPADVARYLADTYRYANKQTYEFAGIKKQNQPIIMGVLNVTPDSFSDGGCYFNTKAALSKVEQMLADGVDIIDIGGESTRPGAKTVAVAEEITRVVDIIKEATKLGALVSIDTRKAEVMQAAIDAGATIVNDVSALSDDKNSLSVIKNNQHVYVVLMHKIGNPDVMQNYMDSYDNLLFDIYEYLQGRISLCEASGIGMNRIAVDVGIGFAKSLQHNITLMNNLNLFTNLRCPVLLGASRKGYINKISKAESVDDRLAGTIAANIWAANVNTDILRVHDIYEIKQALRVWQAIKG